MFHDRFGWYRISCVLLVTYTSRVLLSVIVDIKVQVSNEKDKTLVFFRVYMGTILPSFVGIIINDYFRIPINQPESLLNQYNQPLTNQLCGHYFRIPIEPPGFPMDFVSGTPVFFFRGENFGTQVFGRHFFLDVRFSTWMIRG